MFNTNLKVHSKEVTDATYAALARRNVTIRDIAEIVYDVQSPYSKGLTLEHCDQSVHKVLQKREVQHAVLVGIELDELAEKGLLSEPLQQLIVSDESLFGIDETLAVGATQSYGSIALTTYGHLDKEKVGIINHLDSKDGKCVNTFLDDLVGSVAACASARLAHAVRDLEERGETLETHEFI